MKIFKNKFLQRKLVCIGMAILFGLLCVQLANANSAESIWGTPLMWSILYNRILIGVFVTFIGAFNWHGVLKIKYSAWFRGLMTGVMVSLAMAIGVFVNPTLPVEEIKTVFWATILSGGFYGMLIDVVATRVVGDGKNILKGWTK